MIHAHNPPDLFVATALFWKLGGKRFVHDQHDLAPEMFEARFGDRHPVVRRVLLFFERLSRRVADHVIATNESYRRLQIDRDRVEPRRTTVVRNGPEPFHFQTVAHPVPPATCRGRSLATWQMGRQDGVDYLVLVLSAHLRHTFHREDWIAVLVGEGEVLSELQSLAGELGIADKLTFTGRVTFEEVVPYLAAMDICTAPDPANGYNDRSTLIKVMEYMAQGKPAAPRLDLAETSLQCGGLGVYVTPNDEGAFAAALAALMDDPERRAALGAAGRRRAEDELAWEHSAGALVRLYAALVGVPRPASSGLSAPAAGHTT